MELHNVRIYRGTVITILKLSNLDNYPDNKFMWP